MMNDRFRRARLPGAARPLALALGVISILSLTACGGDDDGNPGDDGGDGDPTFDDPLYALMTQVYAVEDRTVYATLSDTLDLTEVDLDGSREFNGVANFAAVGGALLVSDGERPVITRFQITDEHEWIEGDQVSFADYPLGDNANFYYQFILDEHTAYMPYEGTKRIVWDPTDMAITGALDDTNLVPAFEGLTLEAGGNRDGVRYDEAVMQALFYHDDDWFEFATLSHIAVYDPETHAEERVMDVPCPGLAIATRDDEGFTYFSTWDYMPVRALFGDAPPPCVVRVGPDLELDEDFTSDLTEWTEGRYAVNFRHVGGGLAVANVFHHEELDVDWKGELDPAIFDVVYATGPHWRLWLFDLEAGSATPVEGIDVAISSGAQVASLDGRIFVFLPYDDWSRTAAYEIGADGIATRRFDTQGDVFKWVRIR
jgi:hypothetical protein